MCDINTNMCRICLAEKKEDFEHLFIQDSKKEEEIQPSQLGKYYQELLFDAVPSALLGSEYNINPRYVCLNCKFQLEAFHEFKKKALESYHLFSIAPVFCKVEEMESLSESQENTPDEYDTHQQVPLVEEVEEPAEPKNDDLIDLAIESNEKEDFNGKNYEKFSKVPKNRTYKNRESTSNYEREQCKFCNEIFPDKLFLVEHMEQQHISFKCDICSKKFYTEMVFQAHMNVHMNLPAYKCSECSKDFKQKVQYEYHMRRKHRNEPTYVCEVCGKSFYSKGDLVVHGRIHTGERRYACDICNKRFLIRSHMTGHRYIHFENQLECETCHQKYRTPKTLRTHIQSVHLKLTPFECKICGKKFKRDHHLKQHTKAHH